MLIWLACLVGVYIIGVTCVDTFQTILMPRTTRSRARITSRYFQFTWRYFSRLADRSKRPHQFRAVFGPLSLIGLFGVWTLLLIVGFALVLIGVRAQTMQGPINPGDALYFSGVTFFTLGFGDITLVTPLGRFLSVAEAGVGFGFLAVVIGYLPVFYSTFSRRELLITLMDARAGSPPSGGEMVRRFAVADDLEGLREWLVRWETWSGEFLETHLSYPSLVFYRSQHSDTSWLTALTSVMDACCLIKTSTSELPEVKRLYRQASLTFAMSRHALIDLAQVITINKQLDVPERITEAEFESLQAALMDTPFEFSSEAESRLNALRANYESTVYDLSWALDLPLPTWTKSPNELDNWQSSANAPLHL